MVTHCHDSKQTIKILQAKRIQTPAFSSRIEHSEMDGGFFNDYPVNVLGSLIINHIAYFGFRRKLCTFLEVKSQLNLKLWSGIKSIRTLTKKLSIKWLNWLWAVH